MQTVLFAATKFYYNKRCKPWIKLAILLIKDSLVYWTVNKHLLQNLLTGYYFWLNNPISLDRNNAMAMYLKYILSVSKYQSLTKYIHPLLFFKNRKYNFWSYFENFFVNKCKG